jgi:hypothetical protein
MTTPQHTLQQLEYKVRRLCALLEGDPGCEEDGIQSKPHIIEALSSVAVQNQEILGAQQRLENLMNLIVKLLSQKEN